MIHTTHKLIEVVTYVGLFITIASYWLSFTMTWSQMRGVGPLGGAAYVYSYTPGILVGLTALTVLLSFKFVALLRGRPLAIFELGWSKLTPLILVDLAALYSFGVLTYSGLESVLQTVYMLSSGFSSPLPPFLAAALYWEYLYATHAA